MRRAVYFVQHHLRNAISLGHVESVLGTLLCNSFSFLFQLINFSKTNWFIVSAAPSLHHTPHLAFIHIHILQLFCYLFSFLSLYLSFLFIQTSRLKNICYLPLIYLFAFIEFTSKAIHVCLPAITCAPILKLCVVQDRTIGMSTGHWFICLAETMSEWVLLIFANLSYCGCWMYRNKVLNRKKLPFTGERYVSDICLLWDRCWSAVSMWTVLAHNDHKFALRWMFAVDLYIWPTAMAYRCRPTNQWRKHSKPFLLQLCCTHTCN